MTQDIHTLAKNLESEVQASLTMLQTRLSRVEKELDLECSNLRDLVNTKNPEVNRHLDSLSQSISELHESLAEVRGHLTEADSEGKELKAVTRDDSGDLSAGGEKQNDDSELSPEEISRIRHDEKVTLGGIFRAMFMADEPEQRNSSND